MDRRAYDTMAANGGALCLLLLASIVLLGLATGHGRCQSAELLADPGFEELMGRSVDVRNVVGEWVIPAGRSFRDGVVVKAVAEAAHSGKAGVSARIMEGGRTAAISQTVAAVEPDLYEFTVYGKGDGYLVLAAGNSRRRFELANDWRLCSLLFEVKERKDLHFRIEYSRVLGAGQGARFDDASVRKADASDRRNWQHQEKARGAFGFVPELYSAQKSSAGEAARYGVPDPEKQMLEWREKVVYHDPTYDVSHVSHPEALARYLEANGFEVKDASALGKWVQEKIASGARGTVLVMSMGIAPASVYEEKAKPCSLLKYLTAGGRMIWLGNIPFNFWQNDIRPQVVGYGYMLYKMLSVRSEWDSPAWDNEGKVEPTELGRSWGNEVPNGPRFAAFPEDVTAVLSQFWCDRTECYLAVNWFKNFAAQYPWSGFVYSCQQQDLSNPDLQEQVYRLALYHGTPVKAPSGRKVAQGQEASSGCQLTVSLGKKLTRRSYLRGETILVQLKCEKKRSLVGDRLVCELKRDADVLLKQERVMPRSGDMVAVWSVETADLACGEYTITCEVLAGGKVINSVATQIALCPKRPDPDFFYGAWAAYAWTKEVNRYRADMMLKEFAANSINIANANSYMADYVLDESLKYGIHCSLKSGGRIEPPDGWTNHPEFWRREPNGQPVSGFGSGKPVTGLVHPQIREMMAKSFEEDLRYVANYPSVWPYIEVNDDFTKNYGLDYCACARGLYKARTGLEPPVPPELTRPGALSDFVSLDLPEGIVPDDDPWLQWNIFATKEIGGGFNRAQTEVKNRVFSGGRVGPVPGAMGIPLWLPGQYPPHQFGKNGFDLLQYYYYNGYWQPPLGNLYWDEIARMANRDLPLWTLADCYLLGDWPSYYRNAFFLHLAGGVSGLKYYGYTDAIKGGWDEVCRLGRTVVRPLAPLLGRLRPTRHEVGLLLPYSQAINMWTHPYSALYAYANLLQAHVDVEPTCEEEIVTDYLCGYKVVLLWNVRWLRQSVKNALERYIARGGKVLMDVSTSVPIEGALKLNFDLATGMDSTRRLPGIHDYAIEERIRMVRSALDEYAKPWAEADRSDVIMRRHRVGGADYLWVVNVDTHEEYGFLRPCAQETPMADRPPQKAKEFLKERGAYDGRYTATISVPPRRYAVYDLLAGKEIRTQNQGDRVVFAVDMDRFGGNLIGLYPQAISRVIVRAPKSMKRGASGVVEIKVLGPDGKRMGGVQAYELKVLTPEGISWEWTGHYAADRGYSRLPMRIARNHPAGRWRIEVKEQASGVKGATVVSVQ